MHNRRLSSDTIVIYCDGSCASNPGGKGGYAAIIFYNDLRLIPSFKQALIVYGFKEETTNNVMELYGAMKPMEWLLQHNLEKVVLYTDSQYICHGINNWMQGWCKNNWKTVSGQPVKNKEIWVRIHELKQQLPIVAEWIKAHHTSLYNNIVDAIAKYCCISQRGGMCSVDLSVLAEAFWRGAVHECLQFD